MQDSEPLENGVNKRCDTRTAGKDNECAEQQQTKNDGQEPIFLAGVEETPQVFQKVQTYLRSIRGVHILCIIFLIANLKD